MSFDYSTLTAEQLNNMSDEEFAALDKSQLRFDDQTPVDEPQAEETNEPAPVAEPVVDPEPEPTPEPEPASEGAPSVAVGGDEGAEPNKQGEAVTTPEPTPTPTPTPEAAPVELSAEQQFYNTVTSTFKANGREYKIDNGEDAVKLMQMGLNYNQKMAALKPSLGIVRALEERGITSLDQLGYLFDLQAKKPEAIAKLIQESGIDAYELNEDKAKGYQPTPVQVDELAVNFNMVAQTLEEHPGFGTLVGDMKGFDTRTKEQLYENPHLMTILSDQVANGQYAAIRSVLDKEQALGRMVGVDFLAAYDAVGKQLFGQPQAQPAPVAAPVAAPVSAPIAQPVATPVASKPKPSNNAARTQAAGAPATAKHEGTSQYTQEQIWKMSDEEYLKIDPKFLKGL